MRTALSAPGAIVVDSVPANCVAAGNPARVVKRLDPEETFTTRAAFFADPAKLSRDFMAWEQAMLQGNTFFGWLRHLLFSGPGGLMVRETPNQDLIAVLMPHGMPQLEWTAAEERIGKSRRLLQDELYQRFASAGEHWLLSLGFADADVSLSPVPCVLAQCGRIFHPAVDPHSGS